MSQYRNLSLPCVRPSFGEVKRVWVSQRSRFGRWLSASNAGIAHAGVVIGHTGTQDVWYEAIEIGSAARYTQSMQANPRLYDITLSFNIQRPDELSRAEAEQLYAAQNTIYIVLDGNGQFWLIGEERGCTVTYEQEAGANRGDANDIKLTARCQQRYPLRVVDSSYLTKYVTERTEVVCACDVPLDDICAVPYATLCGYNLTCAPPPPFVPLPALVPPPPPFAFNNAWRFVVNDYARTPDAASLNFGQGDFSFSIWYRPTSIIGERALVAKRLDTEPGYYLFAQGGAIRFAVLSNGVGYSILSGAVLTIDEWQHLGVVLKGTNREDWKIYRNGIMVAQGSGTDDGLGLGRSADVDMSIGTDSRPGFIGTRILDGDLDEMQAYNAALTDADMLHLYNSGLGNAPIPALLPNLVLRYSFDTAVDLGGEQWVLEDVSGNGNDGTGFNMLTTPLVAH